MKIYFKTYLPHALVAAVLYLIPVLFFILNDNYTDAYVLYIGNVLFAAGILFAARRYNRNRGENAQPMNTLASGIGTTLMGIVVAFFLLFLIVAIDIPHLFRGAGAGKRMTEAPANVIKDSTNGLKFMLFMNDFIGNFMAGAFVTVFYTFTAKRDQTGQTSQKRQHEAV